MRWSVAINIFASLPSMGKFRGVSAEEMQVGFDRTDTSSDFEYLLIASADKASCFCPALALSTGYDATVRRSRTFAVLTEETTGRLDVAGVDVVSFEDFSAAVPHPTAARVS